MDVEFDKKRTNAKNLMLNEIYTPILDPWEKSIFYVLQTTVRGKESQVLMFKAAKKNSCHQYFCSSVPGAHRVLSQKGGLDRW